MIASEGGYCAESEALAAGREAPDAEGGSAICEPLGGGRLLAESDIGEESISSLPSDVPEERCLSLEKDLEKVKGELKRTEQLLRVFIGTGTESAEIEATLIAKSMDVKDLSADPSLQTLLRAFIAGAELEAISQHAPSISNLDDLEPAETDSPKQLTSQALQLQTEKAPRWSAGIWASFVEPEFNVAHLHLKVGRLEMEPPDAEKHFEASAKQSPYLSGLLASQAELAQQVIGKDAKGDNTHLLLPALPDSGIKQRFMDQHEVGEDIQQVSLCCSANEILKLSERGTAAVCAECDGVEKLVSEKIVANMVCPVAQVVTANE